MFNGYTLKTDNYTELIYTHIDDPKSTIIISAFPDVKLVSLGPCGPLKHHLEYYYCNRLHNLLGPAKACFICTDGKYNVFEQRYFIAGYYMPKDMWTKIVTAMKSDKSKSFKKLEKELLTNYDKFMAYLLDRKVLDPIDLSIHRLECLYNYLKNKEIKDNIDSILIIDKLTSEGEQ